MRALALVVLAAALSACSTYTDRQEGEVTVPETAFSVERGIPYSPPDWPEVLRADVYLPDTPGRRPAVLVVHGGGWEGRSRSDMDRIARALAAHGFVAVNVDYRLAPVFRFPAPLEDLQQAMHWIHANADRFGIDPDRIGAWGYSAGAHLVSLLALVAGEGGELDRPCGGPQTRPAAVVAGGTPSDLRKYEGGRLVPQFLGGTPAEVPRLYGEASPVTHVHSGAPPFFLYHGTLDTLVSVDHATDFRRALRRRNVEAQLYLLKLRGHITGFLFSAGARRAAIAFLHERLVGGGSENAHKGDDHRVAHSLAQEHQHEKQR